jgi:hypothetical protein
MLVAPLYFGVLPQTYFYLQLLNLIFKNSSRKLVFQLLLT